MRHAFVLSVALAALPAPTFAHHEDGPTANGAPPRMIETDFGRTGDAAKATRTIHVEMADTMRFTPAYIEVQQGDTIRFVVKNSGKVMHEMVLGTMQALQHHAELMNKHPEMEHHEPYMAHVPPGKTAIIFWEFSRTGDFNYGCLVPGHLEAGMIGRIRVVAYQGRENRALKSLSQGEVEWYVTGPPGHRH